MTIHLISFASLLHKQVSLRSSHEAILSELEKKVKGEKIRHLTEYVLMKYKPLESIVFRISRYIKGENQEEYIVYYKFEGFIS